MIYFAKVNDQKFYREFDPSKNGNHSGELESFAKEAVSSFKLKTNRKAPKKIKVEIWNQSANNGKLTERQVTSFEIMPELPPMDKEEFAQEQERLLAAIPDEFHGFVSYRAWDQGHSSGYEEVLLYVTELVDELKGPIKEFEVRLKREH